MASKDKKGLRSRYWELMRAVAEPDDYLTDAERCAIWKPRIVRQDKREWAVAHLEDRTARPFDGYEVGVTDLHQNHGQDQHHRGNNIQANGEIESPTRSTAAEGEGREGFEMPKTVQDGLSESDTSRNGNEEVARRGGYFEADNDRTQRIKSEDTDGTQFIRIDDSDDGSESRLFFSEQTSEHVVEGDGTEEEPYLLDED